MACVPSLSTLALRGFLAWDEEDRNAALPNLPGELLQQIVAYYVKESPPLRDHELMPFLLPSLPVLDLSGTCTTDALFINSSHDFSGLEELRLAGQRGYQITTASCSGSCAPPRCCTPLTSLGASASGTPPLRWR